MIAAAGYFRGMAQALPHESTLATDVVPGLALTGA